VTQSNLDDVHSDTCMCFQKLKLIKRDNETTKLLSSYKVSNVDFVKLTLFFVFEPNKFCDNGKISSRRRIP